MTREQNSVKAALSSYEQELQCVAELAECDGLRQRFLGKKGLIKGLFANAKNIESSQRKAFIAEINAAKAFVESSLTEKADQLAQKELNERLETESIDISLPGTVGEKGARHPLTRIERRCLEILASLGFTVADGPEVETPYHNFDALNIPEHHPARDLQDTFWLDNGLLLRSHTSTVQIRVLEQCESFPVKIVSPGKVYRNESVDATHLACFHQFEGMWIDKNIGFPYLKGTLEYVINEIYGDEWEHRFKPKYYPYTEPSIGMDIRHKSKATGWITILGAGMVHPNVIRQTGHDPSVYQGFAFGLGISRMVAMAYHVENMKSLYEGDLRVHRALSNA